MIYNLVQYVKNLLPLISFVANGFAPDSPKNCVMLSDSGGDPKHWYSRTDWTVQIISRAPSMTIAKKQIDQVYDLLKNKFGVSLPSVVVDGITYPAKEAYQISPIQTPGYLGASDTHGEMFSFNIVIVTT